MALGRHVKTEHGKRGGYCWGGRTYVKMASRKKRRQNDKREVRQ